MSPKRNGCWSRDSSVSRDHSCLNYRTGLRPVVFVILRVFCTLTCTTWLYMVYIHVKSGGELSTVSLRSPTQRECGKRVKSEKQGAVKNSGRPRTTPAKEREYTGEQAHGLRGTKQTARDRACTPEVAIGTRSHEEQVCDIV